jgi:ATP synthase protein I
MSAARPGPGSEAPGPGPRPVQEPQPALKHRRPLPAVKRHEKRGPARGSGPPTPREGTGWAVVSYLVGGMILYGGIGWLIGRWTHIDALFPIGLLLGIGLSLALIIFRFTRQL